MSAKTAPSEIPTDIWAKDLRTLLTEPNPKYTVDTVLPLLRKWYCCCQEPKMPVPGNDPLCFTYGLEMSPECPKAWSGLVKVVIRAHYMTHGFGCDDLLLYQLRAYDVTKVELHAYLHHATKLASFTGLKFLHVDIDAVGRHNESVMAAFDAA